MNTEQKNRHASIAERALELAEAGGRRIACEIPPHLGPDEVEIRLARFDQLVTEGLAQHTEAVESTAAWEAEQRAKVEPQRAPTPEAGEPPPPPSPPGDGDA